MHVAMLFLMLPFLLVVVIFTALIYAGMQVLWTAAMMSIGLLELLVCDVYRRAAGVQIHAGFRVLGWLSFLSGVGYLAYLIISVINFVNILL